MLLRTALAALPVLFASGSWGASPWAQLVTQGPDPHNNPVGCELTTGTTQLFCDPERLLVPEDQATILSRLRLFAASRVHECVERNAVVPLHLGVIVGSESLLNDLGIPADEFIEDFLDLSLRTWIHPTSRDPFLPVVPCGGHIAVMVIFPPTTDTKPVVAARCETAVEPAFTESAYPHLITSIRTALETSPPKAVIPPATRTAVTPAQEVAPRSPAAARRCFQLEAVLDAIDKEFPPFAGAEGVAETSSIAEETAHAGPPLPPGVSRGLGPLESRIRGVQETVGEVEEEAATEAISALLHANAPRPKPTEERRTLIGLLSDRRVQKTLLIVLCIFCAWTGVLEIMRQIILRNERRKQRAAEEKFELLVVPQEEEASEASHPSGGEGQAEAATHGSARIES